MEIVLLAEGTYFEHIDTRSRQIDIVGQGQENTIIDGMELWRPVKITAPVYFSGFAIQNGNVMDPTVDRGGGMLIDGTGGATIDNCLFTNNYNINGAAHLKLGSGAVNTISNCTFLNNSPERASIHRSR